MVRLRRLCFLVAVVLLPCVAVPLRAAEDAGIQVSVTDVHSKTGDARLLLPVSLTNGTAEPATVEIEFSVQQDPSLYSEPVPLPPYGKSVSRGARSWAVIAGEPVVENNDEWGRSNGKVTSINAMTDGRLWTEFGTAYNNKEQWTEAFAYIDLGRVVRIVHMAADVTREPNRFGKSDFAASIDGEEYVLVDGMQGVHYAKGIGRCEIPVAQPFEARYIRMRLHMDGERTPFFRFPAEFHVYTGEDEGTWEFPKVGPVVMEGRLSRPVDANGSTSVDIGDGRPLDPGSYVVFVRSRTPSGTRLTYSHILVGPATPAAISRSSHFGINVSETKNVERLKDLGVAAVRFELKWPAVSAAPGSYDFTAPMSPFGRSADELVSVYRSAGFEVLPCLFLTPAYLAPSEVKGDPSVYPPTDLNAFGPFASQVAARYASQSVHAYELWSGPNTENSGASKWRGPLEDYYRMFRIGAEAVRQADPEARIINGGWTYPELPLLDSMLQFKYPDGRSPLDFTDVLAVRYFSYRIEPEWATSYDVSHHHEGLPYERNVEDDLAAMVAWRDTHKPSMPIWITGIGHDAMGVDERSQAAWLPRGVITALAAGADRVFVHQEKGGSAFQSGANGILRDESDLPKPAYFTYATAIRQLDGITGRALRVPADDRSRIYLWRRGGNAVMAAWAVSGSTKIDLPLGSCTITDAFGHSRKADDVRSIELTGFPVYFTDLDPAVVDSLAKQADAYAAARLERQQRQSKLRAYLFNFGQTQRKGTMVIGHLREFTPVLANDVYDDAKGYGFASPAKRNGLQPYFQHPLTETTVSVARNGRFLFKAEPGEYELQFCSRPSGVPITVAGLPDGDQTIQALPGGMIAKATIRVGDQPVSIETPADCGFAWLAVIERDTSKGTP